MALISTAILGLGDIVYSFYIASQAYGQFDEFQQGQVSTSPVHYTSFILSNCSPLHYC